MIERDLELALQDLAETHVRQEAPADVREDARLVPLTTSQRRSWLPGSTVRFQSMSSATKLLVAGAILALFGGYLLVAQPFDPQEASVPGAASDTAAAAEAAGVAVVGGQLETYFWEGYYAGEELPLLDGMSGRMRDAYEFGRLETDDARLTGEITFTFHEDSWPVPGPDEIVILYWGPMRLENDGGTWEGTHLSWEPQRRYQRFEMPYVGPVMHLSGSGAYEGLSAILHATERVDGLRYPQFAVDGIVFPGELPPSDRRESHEQGTPNCIRGEGGELVPNPDLDFTPFCQPSSD